jgi:hypothetical protein
LGMLNSIISALYFCIEKNAIWNSEGYRNMN